MRSRIALTVLSAAIALGQAPAPATAGAPPEVDQALRARANEFLQYHVEGGPSFRKAMTMVAEDTQDEYFASPKQPILKYVITGVEYNQDYTQATIMVDVSRTMMIFGAPHEVTNATRTSWKIEGGKWMWYMDESTRRPTPMSDGPTQAVAGAAVSPSLPDFSKPETVEKLAQGILRPSSVDKSNVILLWGQASEEQVVFLNQYPGASLELAGVPSIPGLSITLDKAQLNAKEDGVVRFRYAPPAGFDPSTPAPMPFSVALVVVPYEQSLRIRVSFTQP